MAEEKSQIPKLKNVISDESSDDENQSVSDDIIGLPLDKLNIGPEKKLLVLCLGGLLVKRVHLRDTNSVRGLRPDVVHGKCLVFKRPFCTEFLKFCFERFEVGLWSSAREHNIDGVLNSITGGMRSKLRFVWSQEECTDSGFGLITKEELIDLWDKKYITKGQYSSSNTLLIDDEPNTYLLNPPYTAISPHPYKKHDMGDTLLGPNGELRKFLDGLADADVDVPSYVKDHPIGQPAITPSHPDWRYYEKIADRLRKPLILVLEPPMMTRRNDMGVLVETKFGYVQHHASSTFNIGDIGGSMWYNPLRLP